MPPNYIVPRISLVGVVPYTETMILLEFSIFHMGQKI